MRHSAALILVLVVLSVLTIGFTACGGSKAVPLASLKLVSPSSTNFLSLKPGDKQSFAVQGIDKNGTAVAAPTTITWSSNSSLASVSTNTGTTGAPPGTICAAGTWDATFVTCTPTNPAPDFSTLDPVTITATGGGVSGTGTVWVHLLVDNVTIDDAGASPCLVNGTVLTATALNGASIITSTVGPFTWTVVPSTAATVAAQNGNASNNPVVLTVTASQPGVVINASAGGFTGSVLCSP